MTRQFPASADRQVALGAACWVLTVVFFIGQAVAQAASTVPYSLAGNYISDLGNTACGTFTQGAYRADVCSPLHGVMNATFVVTGLLMLGGAVGTRRAWPRRPERRASHCRSTHSDPSSRPSSRIDRYAITSQR